MRLLRQFFRKPGRDPAGSASLQFSPDGLLVLRVVGLFDPDTFAKIQQVSAGLIAKGHPELRVLVRLIDFRGWKSGQAWGDLDFFTRHEGRIRKIAVVCDPAWKDATLTFLAAGHRSGEVRHFQPEHENDAHAWALL
jgi:hypothetical protein